MRRERRYNRASSHDPLPATHPHHRPRDVRRRRHGRGHAQHGLGHGLRHRLAALPRPPAGPERHPGLDRVVASRLRPRPGDPRGGAADRGRAALPGAPLGRGPGRGGLRHRAHPGVAGPDHGRVRQQLDIGDGAPGHGHAPLRRPDHDRHPRPVPGPPGLGPGQPALHGAGRVHRRVRLRPAPVRGRGARQRRRAGLPRLAALQRPARAEPVGRPDDRADAGPPVPPPAGGPGGRPRRAVDRLGDVAPLRPPRLGPRRRPSDAAPARRVERRPVPHPEHRRRGADLHRSGRLGRGAPRRPRRGHLGPARGGHRLRLVRGPATGRGPRRRHAPRPTRRPARGCRPARGAAGRPGPGRRATTRTRAVARSCAPTSPSRSRASSSCC